MYSRTNRQLNPGFTLIELLVVIAIISLLASTVLASLNTARAKSRDAKLYSEMRSMMTAAELYYDDYGYYPPDGMGGAIVNYAPIRGASSNATMRTAFEQYMGAMPTSPSFSVSGKGGSPDYRASYKVVANTGWANSTHGTNCVYDWGTGQGNCYFILVWPETNGKLGPANTGTYYLNGNKIVQMYMPGIF